MFFGREGRSPRTSEAAPTDEAGSHLRPAARVERHHLVFALTFTLAALPILILDNIPANAGTNQTERVVASSEQPTAARLDTTTALETSTTLEATTTTAAPVTTTAAPSTTTTTRPKPVTTTTTRPKPAPTTTTTAPAPAPTNSQEGGASWYDHRAGGCAHRTLPMGTQVRVTNLANGKVATCVVNDRGPYSNGRIIDLDRSVFSQLAPTSAGVINVRIEW